METCWWPSIIWSNANLCHKAGRRGIQFFFFLFGIIWALESTIFKYRMSYFVSNGLVNKYTNKLYTCTPWLVMKASCFCVLWPWTKLKSLKMQKKKQNIKAKQNYNNGKTNKQKHRADILPSWQKKLGQKSIYYVCSHTKISSCEIKAEFVLAGKIDIHINWQVGYSPL